jgi:hypothetical protein
VPSPSAPPRGVLHAGRLRADESAAVRRNHRSWYGGFRSNASSHSSRDAPAILHPLSRCSGKAAPDGLLTVKLPHALYPSHRPQRGFRYDNCGHATHPWHPRGSSEARAGNRGRPAPGRCFAPPTPLIDHLSALIECFWPTDLRNDSATTLAEASGQPFRLRIIALFRGRRDKHIRSGRRAQSTRKSHAPQLAGPRSYLQFLACTSPLTPLEKEKPCAQSKPPH